MFSIDQVLRGYYVDQRPYGLTSGSLRVYLPDLMPDIAMGTPRITPISLNKSCYCNATDCKPAIASKIDTQNYVTATQSYNHYRDPHYYYGSGISVQAKAKDLLSCKLCPEDQDNSVNLYDDED